MSTRVTAIVTVRERFSLTVASIESLLDSPGCPMDVIFVGGGLPGYVREGLERLVQTRGLQVIYRPEYLAPNHARNLALPLVKTEFILFTDNDVFYRAGFLAHLVEAADATGATLVSPITCIGEPLHTTVHLLGGQNHIMVDANGRRSCKVFAERQDIPLADANLPDEPYASELVEFHNLMVRRSYFEEGGALDPEILTFCEETDLALDVTAKGGGIYYAPRAIVTYAFPTSFAFTDVPYFFLRWSDRWLVQSLERIEKKWDLARSSRFDELVRGNGWMRRQLVFKPLVKYLPAGSVRTAIKRVAHAVERTVGALWSRLQSRPAGPLP